jgi:hypothetical protein
MAIVNDEAKVIDIWFTSARKREVKPSDKGFTTADICGNFLEKVEF